MTPAQQECASKGHMWKIDAAGNGTCVVCGKEVLSLLDPINTDQYFEGGKIPPSPDAKLPIWTREYEAGFSTGYAKGQSEAYSGAVAQMDEEIAKVFWPIVGAFAVAAFAFGVGVASMLR